MQRFQIKNKKKMKNTNKKFFAVVIDKTTIEGFSRTCQNNGLKQGFVLAKLIEGFNQNPQIIFK